MKSKSIIKYLAPFTILVIILIFIANIITHGRVVHPGKAAYANKCAGCHGEDGEGIKVLVPPLAKTEFTEANFDSIPCWIINGINHPVVVNGKTYDQQMYGVEMNEIEIANVMNYISKEFMDSDKEIDSRKVKESLKNCK